MTFPLWARLGIGVGLAATLAYMTTPVAIVAARRFAFFDTPEGYKGHKAPTPYLGGAAVMLAFALALVVAAGHARRTLPLLGGVALLWALGTVDDRRNVSPQLRVFVELALGALVSEAGIGWHLGAGHLADALVNGVWVVAVVNAFNLFDNMDGAASTMALVASAGACVLALLSDHVWVAAGSAALCGACLGFLPHNLARPAKIFLGDGGSMPLGFAVAILVASATRGSEPSLLALLTGILLVGVPVLDTCLVIVSRRRRGLSILTAGRDHLTHRTRLRMRTAHGVVLVLGGAQALLSALVIVASRDSSAALVYIVLAVVVVAAVAIIALEDAAITAAFAPPMVAAVTSADTEAADTSARGTSDSRIRGAGSRAPGAWVRYAPLLLLALVGLAAGLSPLFSGYYNSGVWLTVGLVAVVGAAAISVARTPSLSRPALLAFASLAGLGIWSLLSSGWAQAAEPATVDANRWLSYAALLLLVVTLVRTRRRAAVLLVAVGAGIALVAATILVRMLGSDPGALFVAGRLNSPLGYINGEACVFAMGCWFALALAERREALLAGLGAGATVAMACLTILSQSRGAAIAILAALLVALVWIPGARRRILALTFIGAGIAAAARTVLDVYSSAQSGPPPASVTHHAALAILAAAAGTGLLWGAAVALTERSTRREPSRAHGIRQIGTALAIAAVALPVLLGVIRLHSIERTARTQWHAFVHLSDTSSSAAQTRLFTGAGNRYDYWRIAWHVFLDHPLAGVGAGNYEQYYFRARRTQESIQNPHSLELQTLSEQGLVGGVLLALLFAAFVLGLRNSRRRAHGDPISRTLTVAAAGAAVVWLVDTSGDWMHLLPGVTAVGLAALAVLCRRMPASEGEPVDGSSATRPLRLAGLFGVAAIALLLAVAGASLMRSKLAEHYLSSAQKELRSRPGKAVTDANRSLRLDGANLDAYYVKAAGQARFDQANAARSTLAAAAREDPQDFVTWVLLGDLEVRLRSFSAAQSYYGRAHALDPNDPAVAALAANPRSALTSGPTG